MRVIVAGTRDFNDYTLLKQQLDFYLRALKKDEIEIVSGGCSGADALGERYAKENGLRLKIFNADWKMHGKKAGPIRNKEMAKYADALVAFWDNESKGTANMITEAKKEDLLIRIVVYKEERNELSN